MFYGSFHDFTRWLTIAPPLVAVEFAAAMPKSNIVMLIRWPGLSSIIQGLSVLPQPVSSVMMLPTTPWDSCKVIAPCRRQSAVVISIAEMRDDNHIKSSPNEISKLIPVIVKLQLNESLRPLLMISQHWLRQWVDVVRHEAITWVNITVTS